MGTMNCNSKRSLREFKINFIKQCRDEHLRWNQVAEEFNKEFNTNLDYDACRKFYQYHKAKSDYREKVIENDYKVQNNYYIRQEAREDMLKAALEKVAKIVGNNYKNYNLDISNIILRIMI